MCTIKANYAQKTRMIIGSQYKITVRNSKCKEDIKIGKKFIKKEKKKAFGKMHYTAFCINH